MENKVVECVFSIHAAQDGVPGFLEWVMNRYNTIPEEHKATAVLQPTVDEDGCACIELTYLRPYSEAEKVKIAALQDAAARSRRADYERLKKEFEGT